MAKENSNICLKLITIEEMENYINSSKHTNQEFIDNIKKNIDVFKEEKDSKIYALIANKQFKKEIIGIITISESINPLNLRTKILLGYSKSGSKTIELLNQIIDKLKLVYYDKNAIELELLNDINLKNYFPHNYTITREENKAIYTYSNNLNNKTLPALEYEINSTKEKLNSEGNNILDIPIIDNTNPAFDDIIAEKLVNGTLTITDLFSKYKEIQLLAGNPTKPISYIDFERDGTISYISKNLHSNVLATYQIKSNVNNNGLVLNAGNDITKETNNKLKDLHISKTANDFRIETKEIKIEQFNKKLRRIIYTSPIFNKNSLLIQLYIDKDDIIRKCYIDFRIHGKNNKIKGNYNLRIRSQADINEFSINYYGRKGIKKDIEFSHVVKRNHQELYDSITNNDITMELIDELIPKIIETINNRANISKLPQFSQVENSVISIINDIHKQILLYIEQIKDEIPVPHLSNILEDFIRTQEKKKKEEQVLTLTNTNKNKQ